MTPIRFHFFLIRLLVQTFINYSLICRIVCMLVMLLEERRTGPQANPRISRVVTECLQQTLVSVGFSSDTLFWFS